MLSGALLTLRENPGAGKEGGHVGIIMEQQCSTHVFVQEISHLVVLITAAGLQGEQPLVDRRR